MLASHALVILGIPLNRVVKRIRLFREERYQMFKGFFRGVTDATTDFEDTQQIRLHPVEINRNSFARGLRLQDLELERFGVEIQHLRRPNMRTDIEPRPSIELGEGDVVVLLGPQDAIVAAEIYLVSGK